MDIFTRYPRLLDPKFIEEYDFVNCYTARDRLNPYAEEDVAAAIIFFRGSYASMARALGRSRNSVVNYISQVAYLRDLRDEIVESALDDIEYGYMIDALKGVTEARKFFLQTLGRSRGYVTRNESTGPDGGPIHLKSRLDVGKLSTEALEEILNASNEE